MDVTLIKDLKAFKKKHDDQSNHFLRMQVEILQKYGNIQTALASAPFEALWNYILPTLSAYEHHDSPMAVQAIIVAATDYLVKKQVLKEGPTRDVQLILANSLFNYFAYDTTFKVLCDRILLDAKKSGSPALFKETIKTLLT